jgi:hypothetical protein
VLSLTFVFLLFFLFIRHIHLLLPISVPSYLHLSILLLLSPSSLLFLLIFLLVLLLHLLLYFISNSYVPENVSGLCMYEYSFIFVVSRYGLIN